MMRRTREGDFIIEYDGFTARVYDLTWKKLFDGPMEQVLREVEEKLEGELFDLHDLSLQPKTTNRVTSKRKQREWL